jgi:hypothetical protein
MVVSRTLQSLLPSRNSVSGWVYPRAIETDLAVSSKDLHVLLLPVRFNSLNIYFSDKCVGNKTHRIPTTLFFVSLSFSATEQKKVRASQQLRCVPCFFLVFKCDKESRSRSGCALLHLIFYYCSFRFNETEIRFHEAATDATVDYVVMCAKNA